MDILANLGLTAAGIAMLCFGGNWLVSGGVSVAKRFGIPSMVIGMTVVAWGTSTPELAASIAAASVNETDIILGNIVGSNIANVGMVIGAAAVLTVVAVNRRTLRREIPLMVAFSVLLVGVSADGAISRYDGIILLATLAGFTWYTLRGAHAARQRQDTQGALGIRPMGLMALGLGLLYVGAILTVDNAVAAAEWFGISPRIIGITVIAVGTSLPELITTVIAIRKGHTDLGLANIIGSNALNILLIIGVSSVIAEMVVKPVVFVDYAIMIAFSASLFVALRSGHLGRPVGLALVAGYAAYLLSSLA